MTQFIAIEGKGGSGKTYLANKLSERLGAPVFHLDEYGDDYHPFIGIPKLVEALRPAEGEVGIFEGVGVFDERFDEFNAFKILVDVPTEIKRARAAARDVPRSDRSAQEWKQIYEIWRVAEGEYFGGSFSNEADLIVGDNGAFDIELIVRRFQENHDRTFQPRSASSSV